MDRRRFLELSTAAALTPVAACTTRLPGVASRPAGLGRAGQEPARARLRDLGLAVGELPTGPLNAITDIPGLLVGHTTLIRGPACTGVTAVLPHGGDLVREPVAAADFNLNGNGEFTGLGPVRRTGYLAAPIVLTDTGSVGVAYGAALGHMLAAPTPPHASPLRPEPVVGETWGDFLHDTGGRHLGPAHVAAALQGAAGGPVAEGSVGGGTAMRAFRFKAGMGTASRQVEIEGRDWAVGVLVQANCGRRRQLTVLGAPVGRRIDDLLPRRGSGTAGPAAEGNSLLAVVATDAPLSPLQLGWLGKRAALGMARTGATSTHGSGDLIIALSTGARGPVRRARQVERVPSDRVDPLLLGAVEATEEAVLNSLTAAATTTGRDGNTIYALPLDRLVEAVRRHRGSR